MGAIAQLLYSQGEVKALGSLRAVNKTYHQKFIKWHALATIQNMGPVRLSRTIMDRVQEVFRPDDYHLFLQCHGCFKREQRLLNLCASRRMHLYIWKNNPQYRAFAQWAIAVLDGDSMVEWADKNYYHEGDPIYLSLRCSFNAYVRAFNAYTALDRRLYNTIGRVHELYEILSQIRATAAQLRITPSVPQYQDTRHITSLIQSCGGLVVTMGWEDLGFVEVQDVRDTLIELEHSLGSLRDGGRIRLNRAIHRVLATIK